ncbi:hypothetical protein [Bradyrhizobium mercantei]|uniref:hypothetical protein n=1 Tax=Bradyrhizobium mercantei TaxID=1904807 RepID=UPI001177F308|nr:hypothetical protein [Bradyrhizobium mercantei]
MIFTFVATSGGFHGPFKPTTNIFERLRFNGGWEVTLDRGSGIGRKGLLLTRVTRPSPCAILIPISL